jgi:hypothetical protein
MFKAVWKVIATNGAASLSEALLNEQRYQSGLYFYINQGLVQGVTHLTNRNTTMAYIKNIHHAVRPVRQRQRADAD